MNSQYIYGLSDPQGLYYAANKNYVDTSIAKLSFRNYCKYATVDWLNAKYDNGDHGIGATLNANNTGDLFIDDIQVAIEDRILVKN